MLKKLDHPPHFFEKGMQAQALIYLRPLLTNYCSQIALPNSHTSLRSHIKNSCFVFIRDSKHLETIKALGLRPRAFISFSVFGTLDEKLTLVFDLLLHFCIQEMAHRSLSFSNFITLQNKISCLYMIGQE